MLQGIFIIGAISMLRRACFLTLFKKLIFNVQFYSKFNFSPQTNSNGNSNGYHFLYECSSTLRIPHRTFTVIQPVQEKDVSLKMRKKH